MTREEILTQLQEQRGNAQLQVNKLNELIAQVRDDIERPNLEKLLGRYFIVKNSYLSAEGWKTYHKVIGVVDWQTVRTFSFQETSTGQIVINPQDQVNVDMLDKEIEKSTYDTQLKVIKGKCI